MWIFLGGKDTKAYSHSLAWVWRGNSRRDRDTDALPVETRGDMRELDDAEEPARGDPRVALDPNPTRGAVELRRRKDNRVTLLAGRLLTSVII